MKVKANNIITDDQETKLDQAGFIGIDISKDISLFEYNQIAAIGENEILVMYSTPVNDDQTIFNFDYTRLIIDDLIDDLESMDNSFYDFVGTDKEVYIMMIKTIYPYSVNNAISDINSWNGLYKESCYYKFDDLSDLLNYLF